jgi:hypothetical protein
LLAVLDATSAISNNNVRDTLHHIRPLLVTEIEAIEAVAAGWDG